MDRLNVAGLGVILVLAGPTAAGQQAQPNRPNELVTGKLVYVAPMPGGLDQWILECLRRWGKYKVTANPEGVDLYIEAVLPEKERGPVLPKGVPRPRTDDSRFPLPGRCHKDSDAVLAIHVVDWVTGESLWHAHLLNRKPKKDEPEPPPGPHTDIFTRGLVPYQIARKLTERLQEYVAELEKALPGAASKTD